MHELWTISTANMTRTRLQDYTNLVVGKHRIQHMRSCCCCCCLMFDVWCVCLHKCTSLILDKWFIQFYLNVNWCKSPSPLQPSNSFCTCKDYSHKMKWCHIGIQPHRCKHRLCSKIPIFQIWNVQVSNYVRSYCGWWVKWFIGFGLLKLAICIGTLTRMSYISSEVDWDDFLINQTIQSIHFCMFGGN